MGEVYIVSMYGPTLAKTGGWYCHYCKIAIYRSGLRHAQQATIDHKIPLSKGGLTILSNLVLCCQACNVEKRDGDYQEFRDRKAKFRRLSKGKHDKGLVDI